MPKKFQFPSNGKVYPKGEGEVWVEKFYNVSIPFKRESISKVAQSRAGIRGGMKVSIPFKRESISKAFREKFADADITVSIPFKRESISKAKAKDDKRKSGLSFNSLQTGKYIQSSTKTKS